MCLVGKKVNVFYQDRDTVKKRTATVKEESSGFLTIENEYGVEALPNCNIVRVEVLD